MLTKIGFKNYKLFKHYNELEIKPITILFGKNGSGKSSITKFLHVFFSYENNLLNEIDPLALSLNYNNVEIGGEFRDLLYGRTATGFFELFLENENLHNEIVYSNQSRNHFFPVIEKQLIKVQNFVKATKQDTYYLGPHRAIPKRSYNRQQLRIDSEGNHAIQFLLRESEKSESDTLLKLNNWFAKNFDGWGIKVNSENSPDYKIEIAQNSISVNLCDTGYGVAQILPIVISCILPTKRENLLLIYEQPELHLHPAVHGEVAELFVHTAISDPKKRFLIETHSQNFILRVRKLIADGTISPNDVSLNFIDFDEENTTSTIRKINIDEFGKVDFWPEGIFEEAFHEANALRRAQKERELSHEVRH